MQRGRRVPFLGSPISSLSPFKSLWCHVLRSVPLPPPGVVTFGVTSAVELHLCAASGYASFLVDCDRRGDVLQRCPRAVEDDDLVVARAAGVATDDDIRE